MEACVTKRNSVFNGYSPSQAFERKGSLVSVFKNSLIEMLSQYYLQEQFNLTEKRIIASVSLK